MKALALAVLLSLSGAAVAQDPLAIATITVDVPGTWSVEKGYITTRPDGSQIACVLGEHIPAMPREGVHLMCTEFDGLLDMMGDNQTGVLTPLPEEYK
jgi:hypothetical protein